MAFPVAPANGQTAVVNNITYQFSNVGNTWTRILSTANIIVANTLVSNGYISAVGNVFGNYILGNGALLTGVITSVANINSGTSNVTVVSSGGNISVGVGGTANVAVFATTGEYITGVLSVSGNITGNNLSATSNVVGGNLLTAGSISATGTLSVTGNTTVANVSAGNVSAGSLSTSGVISATANVTGGNVLTGGVVSAAGTITGTSHLGSVVSVTGNITGGNLLTGGLISATGNITGNFFIGNGSQLTGLPATYGNANVVANLAALGTNPVSTTGNVTGGNLLTAGIISATGSITSAGNISLTGNIVDAGELWINTTANGNINLNPNGTGQTNIPVGILGVTGNIQGGNLRTIGLISAAGNIQGGNILTAGQISATGNITANYYVGNGAFLTGLSASTADKIANGATNISIPVASGNIAMSVAGQANTVVINLGSFTMYGTFAGPKTLQANVTVAEAVNAMLLGPVSIGDGYNISVPSTSTLYVYAP